MTPNRISSFLIRIVIIMFAYDYFVWYSVAGCCSIIFNSSFYEYIGGDISGILNYGGMLANLYIMIMAWY